MSLSLSRPNDPGRHTPQQFNLISSAEMVSIRVNTILGIVNTLTPKVTEYDEEDPIGTVRQVDKKYDGGVRMAAEATLINAFGRLDSILAEDSVWHSVSIDRMMADKVEELNQINIQIANEQLKATREDTAAQKEANRPYRKYGAKLGLLQSNAFIAYIGAITDPLCIAAQGTSAEEALLNLDNILIARETGIQPKKDSSP